MNDMRLKLWTKRHELVYNVISHSTAITDNHIFISYEITGAIDVSYRPKQFKR